MAFPKRALEIRSVEFFVMHLFFSDKSRLSRQNKKSIDLKKYLIQSMCLDACLNVVSYAAIDDQSGWMSVYIVYNEMVSPPYAFYNDVSTHRTVQNAIDNLSIHRHTVSHLKSIKDHLKIRDKLWKMKTIESRLTG